MAAAIPKYRPDSYMMNFYRMDYETQENDFDSSTLRYMKMNNVFDPYRQSAFEARVKKWLKDYINNNYSEGTVYVMCIAPGHEAFDDSSFMYSLVKQFIDENKDLNLEDGRHLLQRYITIEKQSNAGANRNEETHRNSIMINIDNSNGKIVIILDDVWTTGCTLRACEEKVRTTGPRDVKILAIGKTV